MTLLDSSIGPVPSTLPLAVCDVVSGVIALSAAILVVLDGDRTADVPTGSRGSDAIR